MQAEGGVHIVSVVVCGVQRTVFSPAYRLLRMFCQVFRCWLALRIEYMTRGMIEIGVGYSSFQRALTYLYMK